MDTIVIKGSINNEQWLSAPICSVVEPEKKSFEEAVAECNAVPLESFIIELKKRVKRKRLQFTIAYKIFLCRVA